MTEKPVAVSSKNVVVAKDRGLLETPEVPHVTEETDPYRELLIGCGRARDKRLYPGGERRGWRNLTTLDNNGHVKPDLWCDLNAAPPWYAYPRANALDPERPYGAECAHELLPDYWDEIHAYEVLEHLGAQGDATALLSQFAELWRILKPNGYLCVTVPSRSSGWLWGDPSHRRAIVPETLVFLDQSQYILQCDAARPTSMSDFRHLYKGDFRCVDQADNRQQFMFILQAVKPSRWVAPGTGAAPT
jgi:hypothetical protein